MYFNNILNRLYLARNCPDQSGIRIIGTELSTDLCTYTEWPQKMYKLFTHQYRWNKFK